MTPTTEFATAAARAADAKVTALVSGAHFVSHLYILVLAPLFPVIRADFDVSYTELGLAIAAFNVTTATLQTPAGFLVDRVSARAVLVGGLVLGAGALAVAGLATSFWLFLAMFAVAGIANAAYHPADYSILSQRVSTAYMGRAYSVHTFAGILGTAVAPATMLFLAAAFGWRGAYIAAALLGFAVAALILLAGHSLVVPGPAKPRPAVAPAKAGLDLLLSAPILVNFLIFVLLAFTNSAMYNYFVVAHGALHGTSLAVANTALTAFLLMGAFGVLLGGVVTSRTSRHDAVVIAGLLINAAGILLIAFVDVSAPLLIAVMALAGLFNFLISPSRDMLVRAVTPPGSFGQVFGFVSTGFNISGIFGPILFGWLMDEGSPRGVLITAAAFSLAAIVAVKLAAAQPPR
jgi:MFS family permease